MKLYRTANKRRQALRQLIETACTYTSKRPPKLAFTDDTGERELMHLLVYTWNHLSLQKVPLKEWLEEWVRCFNRKALEARRKTLIVEHVAEALFRRASMYIESEKFEAAFYVLSAVTEVFEVMYCTLTDDVSAICAVEKGIEMLGSLSEKDISDDLHRKIFLHGCSNFERCFQEDEPCFDLPWLKLTGAFVRTPGERKIIEEYFGYCTAIHRFQDYSIEEWIEEVRLNVYENVMSEDEFMAYLHANMESHVISTYALDVAKKTGNYLWAEQLCRNRMETTEGFHGILWHAGLYRLGCHSGNISLICEGAERMLMAVGNINWYLTLKKHTNPGLWQGRYFRQYLKDRSDPTCLIRALIIDEEWEELEEKLRLAPFTWWIKLEKLLLRRCPWVLEKLFDVPVWNQLRNRQPGVRAKKLARYLRRAQKRVGQERMADFMRLLKACHPKKKRLIRIIEQQLLLP
jgi:hypothetical protein